MEKAWIYVQADPEVQSKTALQNRYDICVSASLLELLHRKQNIGISMHIHFSSARVNKILDT